MTVRTAVPWKVVVVALGLLLTTALTAHAVILANPGFEADDASGGDVYGALGWGAFNTPYTTTTVTPHSGTQCLKIFGPFFNGGGSGVVQGTFPAAENQVWTATAWAMNSTLDPIDPSNFAVVKIEFLDSTNSVITGIESPHIDSTLPLDTWTQFTAQGAAPADTVAAQIVLVHVQLDPITGGSVFFDDATLIPEPASLALLGLGGLTLLFRRR
jgi:PEP-CTERM motif